MRKYIIAGNWKMNMGLPEAANLAKDLVAALGSETKVDVVVCPPYIALSKVGEIIKGTSVKLGAQDAHWEENGAYTGKVSVSMLKAVGVDYVILGHSEQRQFFHETDATVNKKVKKVLEHGLTPIVCVGELLEERKAEKTLAVIKTQVEGAYAGLTAEQAAKTVIAYEPVWAIGTGLTASDAQAQEVHAYIRGLVKNLFGAGVADGMRIQYGGSMKADNAKGLLGQPDVDGGLIGGAALKAESFKGIITAA